MTRIGFITKQQQPKVENTEFIVTNSDNNIITEPNSCSNTAFIKKITNSELQSNIDEYSDPSDIEDDYSCDDSDEMDESDESEDLDAELFAEIDANNANKVFEVSKLASKIFKEVLIEETQLPVSKEKILEIQKEITPKHRELAVRWLIQLNYHYKLTSDTLYSAVAYLDIVLSKLPLSLKELQLYSAVCYWMAAKVDNRFQPSVKDFNEIANESFTVEQFSVAEIKIFTALDFKMSFPTSKFFMRRLLYLTSGDKYIIEMANFFTEVALQKWDFVGVSAYNVATAAIFTACATLDIKEDAFSVIRAARDKEMFIKCTLAMIGYGAKTFANKNIAQKSSELFSRLNFDVDITQYTDKL